MDFEKTELFHMLMQKATTDIDDLLDDSTPSCPAVWDRSSQTLFRVHLSDDDERLPKCKEKIKAIKEAIKIQLQKEFGDTWEYRMPFDHPICKNEEAKRVV